MQNTHAILAARAAIGDNTPLLGDCGGHCGAACCQDGEDGETLGMELFPGEEALYPGGEWYLVYRNKAKAVLVCEGRCPREHRPLACRIFPLTFYVKNGKPRVVMDRRAAPICPLYAHGSKGLSRGFVTAANEAAGILWQSDAVRDYIMELSLELDELAEGLEG